MANAFKELSEFLDDLNLLWVDIAYAAVGSGPQEYFLKPGYTNDELTAFRLGLLRIEYSRDYGRQELFGSVVFTDGTYLSRWEYDGSEGWCHRVTPTYNECVELVELKREIY